MLHNPNLDIWYTQSSMFFRRNSWNTHAISFQRLWCESSCCSLNSRDGFPRSLSHAGLVIQLHPRLLLNMENDTIAPSVTFCYSCESLATILCSFCAWQVFPNVAVVVTRPWGWALGVHIDWWQSHNVWRPSRIAFWGGITDIAGAYNIGPCPIPGNEHWP